MLERTFIVNSFSKGFAMTGYRLGYVAAKQEYIKQLVAIQSQITTSPNYISQRCGEEILRGLNHIFLFRKVFSVKNLKTIVLGCLSRVEIRVKSQKLISGIPIRAGLASAAPDETSPTFSRTSHVAIM